MGKREPNIDYMENFETVEDMFGLDVAYLRRKGSSHVRKGMPCQDYVIVEQISKDVAAMVVADGHGNEKRHPLSEYGSKFVCESVVDVVRNRYDALVEENNGVFDETNFVDYLNSKEFKANISSKWREKVIKHYCERESIDSMDNERDRRNTYILYGSTMLFVIATENYYFAGQLGDGAVMLYNNIEDYEVVKRVPDKESQVTDSICEVYGEFERLYTRTYSREDFSSIFISTDGIYDCYSHHTGEEAHNEYCANAVTSLVEEYYTSSIDDVLSEFDNEVVYRKTGDDCTVVFATVKKEVLANNQKQAIQNKIKYNLHRASGHSERFVLYKNDESKYLLKGLCNDLMKENDKAVKIMEAISVKERITDESGKLVACIYDDDRLNEYTRFTKLWTYGELAARSVDDEKKSKLDKNFAVNFIRNFSGIQKHLQDYGLYFTRDTIDLMYVGKCGEIAIFAETLSDKEFDAKRIDMMRKYCIEHTGIVALIEVVDNTFQEYMALYHHNIGRPIGLQNKESNTTVTVGALLYKVAENQFGMYNPSDKIWYRKKLETVKEKDKEKDKEKTNADSNENEYDEIESGGKMGLYNNEKSHFTHYEYDSDSYDGRTMIKVEIL